MKKTFIFLSAVLALTACAEPAHRHDNRSVYIDKGRLEALAFEPAPSANSPLNKADYETLHMWQNKRTNEQCRQAENEAKARFEDFFGDLRPFSMELPKESADFLLRVREDASTAVTIIKERNKRKRPFLTDKSIKPCIKLPGGLGYPSGHATLARLYALMLSDIMPLRRSEFIARADQAALNRVISGVHHPTDVEAGKKLGDILFTMFLENAEFRKNMEKLKNYAAK